MCLGTSSLQAQVTSSPEKVTEPVDPVREQQKEAYYKKLKEGENTQVVTKEIPQEKLPEALPEWKDTGNHEADVATYREAVNAWVKRNGKLYEKEEIEFLFKPILKLEERERTLKNL